jgi:hypothetical protein
MARTVAYWTVLVMGLLLEGLRAWHRRQLLRELRRYM